MNLIHDRTSDDAIGQLCVFVPVNDILLPKMFRIALLKVSDLMQLLTHISELSELVCVAVDVCSGNH